MGIYDVIVVCLGKSKAIALWWEYKEIPSQQSIMIHEIVASAGAGIRKQEGN